MSDGGNKAKEVRNHNKCKWIKVSLPIKDRDYEIFKRIKIQHQLCIRNIPKTMTQKYPKRNISQANSNQRKLI